MNREKAAALLPIIKAYAEGKTVQMRVREGWIDASNPTFCWHENDYRIKSRELIVGDVVKNRGGETVRIICIDVKGSDYPVVGLRMRPSGEEQLARYKADGTIGVNTGSFFDLVL